MLKYVKKIYGTDFIRYPQKLKTIVCVLKKDSNLDSKEKNHHENNQTEIEKRSKKI